MQIRRAEIVDAETLAKAEYETAAAQEGLLAAQPGEIPMGSFREKIESLQADGLYVVIEMASEIVGHLILEPLGLNSTNHVVQLTIVVHPGHTGKGYGSALMKHAIAWATQRPETSKIELRVRSTNPAAIRLYESFGFLHEGILKKRVRLTDGYADDICMGLFVDSSAD